jgi:hypothetical protein
LQPEKSLQGAAMKHKWLLILGVLVLLLGIGVWSSRDTFATARIGTTYVAKQTCSCLFVAGRSLDSCHTDFEPETVSAIDIQVSERTVTASALRGFISARAQFDQGYGCHPAN